MRFPAPLERGRLVRRYKRFLADVELDDGCALTVHVPNPGAMLGLNTPGLTVWLSPSPSPTRKLSHTLEMVEADGGLVGVNTMNPNRLAAEALEHGRIPELVGYDLVRREVRYGQASRIDFLLSGPGRPDCWLEVKNCHFRRDGALAEFPDCVAARSLKHLGELEAMAAQGDRAVMLFVIQRSDCEAFAAAQDIDPAYAAGLQRAAANGVEVLAYACELSPQCVEIAGRVGWRDLPVQTLPIDRIDGGPSGR
jgi:sugar fermentation stimulation protein A